jgi:hypothetical protein
MEIFKNTEFEDYEISNLGNVKYKGELIPLLSQKTGYNHILINGKIILIHRLVGKAFIPNPENKLVIDHINHKRNDNILENLRWATKQENAFNRSLHSNNKTGITGVYFHNGWWSAKIGYNRKLINIGYYKSKEKAILARKAKEDELFKSYKCINEQTDEELEKELEKIFKT